MYVSVASVWEICIKRAIGKLDMVCDFKREFRRGNFFELHFELQITTDYAIAAAELPFHHHDPFDRMLVAQAMLEDLTTITRDANIARYPVKVLPA